MKYDSNGVKKGCPIEQPFSFQNTNNNNYHVCKMELGKDRLLFFRKQPRFLIYYSA